MESARVTVRQAGFRRLRQPTSRALALACSASGTISHRHKLFYSQHKEMAMRKHLLPTVAGLLLLAGTGLAAADTIIITPEQETVIHDYVGTQHVDPYIPEDGVDINVGTALPD